MLPTDGQGAGPPAGSQPANLSIREILYVGDEVRDIDAAGSIGMDIAAVTWGFNSKAALVAAEPTYVIEHASELPGLVGEA